MRATSGATAGVLVLALAAGCGSAGDACKTDADCAAGASCLFPVGSCSAVGRCLAPRDLGIMCEHVVTYCGCDGTTVPGLCGPDYASAPTLGKEGPCGP
ncbi:MAG TPA: hypothetical protein VHL80_19125, partial [Polyangia bacterium]|nr:hypothetical protein [Polyangia bacterium]